MLLFWSLLGVLIGLAAAQRKGFSMVGGVLGGLLLGPLAFLLFFVSGISKGDSGNKKCPSCAEWIKAEATVCKHCHSPVVAAARVGGPRPVAVRPPVRRAS